MDLAGIEVGELAVDFAPAKVPYVVLLPDDGGPHPLCLFLHGGGGSHQNLIDMRPLFERWWSDGSVAPLVIAMARTGAMSYYLDHPDGSARWESFIAEAFIAHLRGRTNVARDRDYTFYKGIQQGRNGVL